MTLVESEKFQEKTSDVNFGQIQDACPVAIVGRCPGEKERTEKHKN